MESDLKHLTERLALVEKEVASIRRELVTLVHSEPGSVAGRAENQPGLRTDKELQRRLVGDFLAEFNIEGKPVAPEELQKPIVKS